MVYIYVLELQYCKYYVGKTSLSVDIRFSQHLNDDNCAFTTKNCKKVIKNNNLVFIVSVFVDICKN